MSDLQIAQCVDATLHCIARLDVLHEIALDGQGIYALCHVLHQTHDEGFFLRPPLIERRGKKGRYPFCPVEGIQYRNHTAQEIGDEMPRGESIAQLVQGILAIVQLEGVREQMKDVLPDTCGGETHHEYRGDIVHELHDSKQVTVVTLVSVETDHGDEAQLYQHDIEHVGRGTESRSVVLQHLDGIPQEVYDILNLVSRDVVALDVIQQLQERDLDGAPIGCDRTEKQGIQQGQPIQSSQSSKEFLHGTISIKG